MNLTLIVAAVIYPLIQGAWESGPLAVEYSLPPMAPTHLENYVVESQGEYFAKASDPLMRSGIAKSLSLSSNPEAVKVLENLAKTEKDQVVRQDLLAAMLALESYAPASDLNFLRGLLKSDSIPEKVMASALLMNASKSPAEAIELLSSERSAYAHKFLWPRIFSLSGKAPSGSLEKLLESQIPLARAGAASALVAAGALKSNSAAFEKLAVDADATVRFALAASVASAEGGERLLEKLSKDSNPSVRAAVALSKAGEGRERILLSLSSDNDAAVRRNACEALASFASDDSAFALSARLGDSDQFVRAASESSLGVIKPSRTALDKIQSLLEAKDSKASAITALGLAKDTEASAKILAILESHPDDNISARAVEALGLLNYKPSTKTVASFCGSSSPKVRKAVAAALGLLKESDGFDALRKLAKDPDLVVGREALRSIGLIGGSGFEQVIFEVLSDFKVESGRRSAASWAAERSEIREQKTLEALKTLAIVTCIAIPMTPEKTYESDDVRISALYALSSLSKRGSAPAKQIYETCMEGFKGPFAKMPGRGSGPLLTPLLEDYVRQLEILREGGSPSTVEVPSMDPELVMKKL